MTVCSGKEIADRIHSTDLEKRLVVSPILCPEEQLRIDQASIDIRLGFEFALVAPSSSGAIDEFGQQQKIAIATSLNDLYAIKYVPLGKNIFIHPHQFILASSLEYLRLPKDLMAYVIGRSTLGRLGLIVATAVGIQPGFAGSLTLELRNLGETPLCLYPGQTIAQLFFHEVSGGGETTDELGQYSGTTDILPKNISSKETFQKIQSLIKKT